MSKRAVILAGGLGTRLKPYTVVLPKPLMPVGDYPILEILIKQLARYGFKHITLAVNHQAEIIKAYFEDGYKWGVQIDYSLEKKPLGTMGPLKIIKDLPDQFLVLNGDVLTDLDFSVFYERHIKQNVKFTISSYKREQLIDYGVLRTVDEQLIEFSEKPRLNHEVSMGVYMLSKTVLEYIPEDFFGFDHLMHKLIAAKERVAIHEFDGQWLDIGRADDYAIAIEIFQKMKSAFLVE